MLKRRIVLLPLFAFAFVAACGGSDGEGDDTSTDGSEAGAPKNDASSNNNNNNSTSTDDASSSTSSDSSTNIEDSSTSTSDDSSAGDSSTTSDSGIADSGIADTGLADTGDLCTLAACSADATCSVAGGMASCTCKTGFSGDGKTCTNIDDCDPNPCMNGGACADGIAAYTCTCANGFSGTTCDVYPPNCASIKAANGAAADGDYTIDPDGNGALGTLTVFCDMTTDGGGYTYYPVTGGVATTSYSEANSCTAVGLQMVIPRTAAHLNAMWTKYGSGYFKTVPGVYGLAAGNYTGCAMNSSDPTCGLNWRALDGGPWFARDQNYGEPNGDYTPGVWLSASNLDAHGLIFNDTTGGGSTGTSYVCSDNAKVCQTDNDCHGANQATFACIAGGRCTGTCNVGYQDCDNNGANGCESSKNNDINNCGACGNVCPGATPLCTAGVCSNAKVYTSCNEIHTDQPAATDGMYKIDPDGNGPLGTLTVYCDMTTDGGGYTSYAITGGISTSKRTDANSCTALGLNIVVPRTNAHLHALVAKYGISYFKTSPGVYGLAAGNYTTCAMNSGDAACAANWKAIDNGAWFLRDQARSEPNGDYTPDCWLSATSIDDHGLIFNDGSCGYSTGTTYVCSDNAK